MISVVTSRASLLTVVLEVTDALMSEYVLNANGIMVAEALEQ